MKKLRALQLLLIAGIFACLQTAAASPVWAGPGWYQVECSPGGYRLVAGPFGDSNACESTLPDDEDEQEFSCQNFAEKPSGSNWWGADFPGT